MTNLTSKPVIIIGAPRSGTNMLRDVLNALPGFHTWPCDEIPYLWRHGNRSCPHDEFSREMATPAVRSYMRQQFNRECRPDTKFLIEKTCANSLRPGFLDEILPEAVFLYIVRNGLDASASAMKRWRSEFDLSYSLAKARYVPWSDVPYYGWRVLVNRVRRALSPEKRLSVWGPVYDGMDQAAATLSLPALAASQWQRCVEVSDDQLAELAASRVHPLEYEKFVADPLGNLAGILDFLGVELLPECCREAVAIVHGGSVGKGVAHLAEEDQAAIRTIIGPKLQEHGYVQP